MKENNSGNVLCISTYFKGNDYIRGCKEAGNSVFLLTKKSLESEAWAWDCITDVFYVDKWLDQEVIDGLAFQFRSIQFDRFVALDDFDVERVCRLREYFRIPGMGDSTAKHFRDKLSMRMLAKESGINVPEFTSLFHDNDINNFMQNVSLPWLIKPRTEASAAGIKKINNKDELWPILDALGDERHSFLIERFDAGTVFHVDSLCYQGKVIFAKASRYLDTPFEVAHQGGIFRSMTLETGSRQEKKLLKMNREVLKSFGLFYGASHTEFIISDETGELTFLETSCRVGGANIAEMVEFASGINLWKEWARIDHAVSQDQSYTLPKAQNQCAGIVVSLCKYEHPDTSLFSDVEIKWRMKKPWHIGLIVSSESEKRVEQLLSNYTKQIALDFHASAPSIDKLTDD